jgi:hypothetical protein
MRQSIILLVVILLAVTLYTAYGLMTFQPDEAKPFVFSEPVLPPELDEDAQTDQQPQMSAAQQEQANAAMAQLSQAMTLYENYKSTAPAQAASTFDLLNRAIFNSKLPAYLVSQSKDGMNLRKFELITLDPNKSNAIKPGETALTCNAGAVDILIGDNGNNKLGCDALASSAALDRMFLGGPGADEINSAHGNRIINAGTGDDTITTGAGRTVILLDDAWGQDTLTVDCTEAKINNSAELPPNFPIPWVQPFTNFIVLGPRINPADVSWNGLVLTNKATGDTLTVNENCFNLVSVDQ